MHMTGEEVDRIAKLARLELTEGEKAAFGKQLDQILAYVQKLKTFQTDGVTATATVAGQTNVFRADVVQPSLSVEEATANAPDTQNQYFRVPRILQDS
ncbi:MAG TPA: Asp-tRNA(Asn)/Glu-tRNA(Gln) amidotransferase subunit GatC [Nitrospiraceae bacterium]|nr:Asp-tRNA(Asn)/Glu-tRNA(Gln) amidotransferase subunit GatC [Nitrospiraceae bacterium]